MQHLQITNQYKTPFSTRKTHQTTINRHKPSPTNTHHYHSFSTIPRVPTLARDHSTVAKAWDLIWIQVFLGLSRKFHKFHSREW